VFINQSLATVGGAALLSSSQGWPTRAGATTGGLKTTAAPLRVEISSENPLFVFNLYNCDTSSIYWLDDNMPGDIKDNWAIQFVSLIKDKPEARSDVEAALRVCDELGFKAFIQVQHTSRRNDVPSDFLDSLFKNHHMLIGLVVAEFSVAMSPLYGMSITMTQGIKRFIDVVVPNGGYFMWQDMGYEWKHPFSVAGSNTSLFEKITTHKENIIFVDKHNGRSKRYVGPASAMGFYVTDQAAAWGINSEDWIWWEAGLGPLFEESVGVSRAHRMWPSVFTYPESLYGAEWLIAAAGGATVYSLECPYHGFATLDTEKRFLPAWHKVILPLVRKLLNDNLIPDRSAVLDKMKVAYHPDSALPREYQDDDLFKSLYGPEESSLYEWLPSTGRYYFLPVLPKLSPDNALGLFDDVITTDYYKKHFRNNPAAKQDYFNARYPSFSEGDSWVVNHANTWYLVNPNENRDVQTDFKFALKNHPEVHLSGLLSSHAHGIVQELSQTDQLKIYLSNYRVDTEKDIWSYTSDKFDPLLLLNNLIGIFPYKNDFDLRTYINHMIDDPSIETQRQSRVSIDWQKDGEPEYEINGNPGFHYTTDLKDGKFTISVWHNGQVDLLLNLK
jgi:hypothetical protein